MERFNPDSCTFFTLVGEMGFAFHEMYAVSGLSWGNLPYEERFPLLSDLARLKKACPSVYETYWELLCHYHICLDSHKESVRHRGVGHLAWAFYLFPNIKGEGVPMRRRPRTKEDITHALPVKDRTWASESYEGDFLPGTVFRSYHYWAARPLSNHAL